MHPTRARPILAIEARSTAAARKEVGKDDPIADLEWLVIRVGRDARPERGNATGTFVALVDRQGSPAFGGIEVTAPGVQIGAAHVGQTDAHDGGAWLRLRHGILAN